VDPEWLGEDWDESQGEEVDDDTCLAFFHRRRTIKLLQGVRDDIGDDVFQQAWLHFDSIRNAGFDLGDVLSRSDIPLINRDYWSDGEDSYEEDDDDEEEEFYDEDGEDSCEEDGDDDEEELFLHDEDEQEENDDSDVDMVEDGV
jgi:hypothetical protein